MSSRYWYSWLFLSFIANLPWMAKIVRQADVMGYKGGAQQSVEYKEKRTVIFPCGSESTFSGMPTYNIDVSGSDDQSWATSPMLAYAGSAQADPVSSSWPV